MLTLNFSRLMADAVGDAHGLTKSDLAAIAEGTRGAHKQLQAWRASQDALFYDVVFEKDLTRGIAEKAEAIASSCHDLVVLGIGGSALGLRCASGALLPPTGTSEAARAAANARASSSATTSTRRASRGSSISSTSHAPALP